MRGSVYYQSSQLVKQIFCVGAKKHDKINPNHANYQKVASYKTMESYRAIWNNFFNYLKEHWKLNNFEEINAHHIVSYMDYKVEYYPSKLYLEKISAALGKLEFALECFSKNVHGIKRIYDFSIRQAILNESRDLKYIVNNYHNRAYNNPEKLIEVLQDKHHKLAAKIQYEGGARLEGVALIKIEQLKGITFDMISNKSKGITFDMISNKSKGVVFTKEKGGKEGKVFISVDTYNELSRYFSTYKLFKINRQKYYEDIKFACKICNEASEGTHGLRWNFAKRRMYEYADFGYSYQSSLQEVSKEMKHNRASITTHYLV